MSNEKLKVWWIPQVPMDNPFHRNVSSIEMAVEIIEVLALYDLYQYDNCIKPNFANAGGLLKFNTETNKWEDWEFFDKETGDYFDDPKDYLIWKNTIKNQL